MSTGKHNPVNPKEIQRMRSLRAQGIKVNQVAKELGRHPTVVSKYTKDLRKEPKRSVAWKAKPQVAEGFFNVDAFFKTMLV